MFDKLLLECNGVKKQVGNFTLKDIQLGIPKGSIIGVIGRNGAGKTTLSRLLLGCYRTDEGNITINGVSQKNDIVSYKEQIAYVLNETPFPLMINSLDCGNLYGSFYKTFSSEKYKGLLKEFDIPEKQYIYKLSKGQQIRQQLAFALSYEANLYILDEPAANLDIEFRAKFYTYVREIAADGNRSVVYISHLVDELEQLADEILWIKAKEGDTKKVGEQFFFGTIEELRDGYQMFETSDSELESIPKELIVGSNETSNHQETLVKIERSKLSKEQKQVSRYASLKEIMYYSEKSYRKKS